MVPMPRLRTFLALLLALLAACGAAAGPDPAGGSGLVLLPYEGPLARGVTKRDARLNFHDFGRVPDGDTVTRVFQMRNEDPRDVAIKSVVPSCGCTVASLRAVRADGTVVPGESIRSKAETLLTIGPGELFELEVRITTRDMVSKNMDKLLNVRVSTDSPGSYFLTFEMHILVEQPFSVVPAALALGSIPENGGGAGKVDIVPTAHLHHVVKELLPPPPGVQAELVQEARSGYLVWVLSVALEPPLARGPYNEVLRLTTDDESGNPGRDLEIPLTAMVIGDFDTNPERIVFAATRDGQHRSSTEFRALLAGHRPRIVAAEVDQAHRGWLSASFEPVSPDDEGSSPRWLLTLETRPPLPDQDMLAGTLHLTLDDPQHPTWEVEYVVHVR